MKIAVLGSKGTTLDFLHGFAAQDRYRIDALITLREAVAQQAGVAFFDGPALRAHCAKTGIRCLESASYNLRAEQDAAMFATEAFDLLFVIGWERLLPPEVLRTLGFFACGMHGSAYGLPRGRGRSPMNWSIITGRRKFVTSLFRYTAEMDAGDIIGTKVFDILEWDDIGTLHHKNRLAMLALALTYLPLIERGEMVFTRQPPEEPSFYPKRTAEDGGIDWSETTEVIHRLIRAVAPPYPGAFLLLGERRVMVSEAQPFDTGLFPESIAPGTILDVSIARGQVVIKTVGGSLLIKRFEGAAIEDFQVGDRVGGVRRAEVMASIRSRYPADVPATQFEVR